MTPLLAPAAVGLDGSPSSLPQILYLAYKNHGLFLLDRLRHDISSLEAEILLSHGPYYSDPVPSTVSSSLTFFVEALDRDDTDLELWRIVSRLGGFLGSRRIARFCLETVLDNDEGDFGASTEPMGLEEGFAEEQIKPLLEALDDRLSRSQLAHMYIMPRKIIAAFKQQLDPCPFLPTPAPSPRGDDTRESAEPLVLQVPYRAWASCGKAILNQLQQEAHGVSEPSPGASYILMVPAARPFSTHIPAPLALTNGTIHARSAQAAVPNPGNLLEEAPKSATIEVISSTTQILPDSAQISPVGATHVSPGGLPTDSANLDIGTNSDRTMIEDDRGTAGQLEQGEARTQDHESAPLPTRKRSSETAELPDAHDSGRTKSKRIKARGSLDTSSLKDSATAEEWARWYEQQLQIYHSADDAAFSNVGETIAQLKLKEPLPLPILREIVSKSNAVGIVPDLALGPLSLIAHDLKTILNSWDLIKSKAFLNGHDPQDPAGGVGGNRHPEVAAFLETSIQSTPKSAQQERLPDDHGLDTFEQQIGQPAWINLDQIAYYWLDRLLGFSVDDPGYEKPTLYQSHMWPDLLKESVVQMLVFQDRAVCAEVNNLIEDTNRTRPDTTGLAPAYQANRAKCKYTHLAQTIFELHLDVFGLITKSTSKVDAATRTSQRDRLSRWFSITSGLMNELSCFDKESEQRSKSLDELQIRFLWASVVYKSLLDPSLRDDTIVCYQDLIPILELFFGGSEASGSPAIKLPNNAIMPEISVSVAQREISRLTMMDFFVGVFNCDNSDPLGVIESLEPLLDLSVSHTDNDAKTSGEEAYRTPASTTSDAPKPQTSDALTSASANPQMHEAVRFLGQGNIALHLFLWQKLRDAYRAIAYPPQVLACELRMIALILDHLSSSSHFEQPSTLRRSGLLRWLHRLDDHISRVLSIALTKSHPFECIYEEQIRKALLSLRGVLQLLHVFALWEDTIRVGRTPLPLQPNQNAVKGLAKSTDKFRDMIVKTWVVQYLLLKEAMTQNPTLFPSKEQYLADHLQRAHQALGLRFYCSLANKVFLKMMKHELESFKIAGEWNGKMSQLMFDLYGVKTSSGGMEIQDHGCLTEPLDKSTALEIMDLVLTQVNRVSIKELMRSDLRFTVDKMQQVIKIPLRAKSNSRILNLRLVNQYLEAPINPLDLFQSLRGIGGLGVCPVQEEGSEVAYKGWYHLLGNMALAKFRSQKRSIAVATDDLKVAQTFFKHDLEYATNRWETWYRLGQVFETTLEEDVTWTADKLDNHMDDIADLQRKVIHCYAMAIVVATQCAEGSFQDTSTLADLYADFGLRIYSSTREPFSMKAFDLDGHKRHFNSRNGGMYERVPFRSMQMYSAWKFASILLRRASMQKPQNWV